MRNVLVLLLCFWLFNPYTAADSYLFIGANFPAIMEVGDDKVIGGLGVDIARRIVTRLGHELNVEIYPWKRALQMVQQAEADVLIGAYKTAAREQYISYSQYPFHEDSVIFYLRADNDFQWHGEYSRLEGRAIGINRGWSYGQDFDAYSHRLNLHVGDSVSSNVHKLILGRIDLFATNPRDTETVIRQLQLQGKIKSILPPINASLGYFGFSRKRNLSGFQQAFDSEFRRMVESGEFQRLQERYQLDLDIPLTTAP